jgi:hypothetical protein
MLSCIHALRDRILDVADSGEAVVDIVIVLILVYIGVVIVVVVVVVVVVIVLLLAPTMAPMNLSSASLSCSCHATIINTLSNSKMKSVKWIEWTACHSCGFRRSGAPGPRRRAYHWATLVFKRRYLASSVQAVPNRSGLPKRLPLCTAFNPVSYFTLNRLCGSGSV